MSSAPWHLELPRPALLSLALAAPTEVAEHIEEIAMLTE